MIICDLRKFQIRERKSSVKAVKFLLSLISALSSQFLNASVLWLGFGQLDHKITSKTRMPSSQTFK